MPIYEYRCSSCGHQQEFLQKLSDAPLTSAARSAARRRSSKMVTAAGFQLKGSGWYATDFKGAGAKPAAEQRRGEAATRSAHRATPKPRETRSAKAEAKPAEPKPDEHAGPATPIGSGPRRQLAHAMGTLRRYFVAGLLVWIPLGITLWVLKLLVDLMDQSLLLLPRELSAPTRSSASTFPGWASSSPSRSCSSPARSPRTSSAASCSRWATASLGPHPDRALHLRRREADQRHALLARGQGVPPRGAGALSARGRVDRGARHRHARSTRSPTILGHDQISVFVPTTPNITAGFFLIVPRSRDDRARDERRRGAQVHHLHGRGRAAARVRPERTLRDRPRSPSRVTTATQATQPCALRREDEHANRILRLHRHPFPRPDRHALRLGAPPPRPRRRDLHRPARPRGPRAGGLRSRPRGDLRDRRPRAQRVRAARDGRGAPPPRGHGERGPEERRDRGARARDRDPESPPPRRPS